MRVIAIVICFILFCVNSTECRADNEFDYVLSKLPHVTRGTVKWGDYDGDNDLDVFIAGWTPAGANLTAIYRNTGGTFEDSGIEFPVLSYVDADWGDFDNDGDLDLVISAHGLADVFRNDQTEFTPLSANLHSAPYGSIEWGDYDNDGDLDLLQTGDHNGETTTVYRNDAGAFVDTQSELLGVLFGSGIWSDYDLDGDLDFLISGNREVLYEVVRIYRNDAGSFQDSGADILQLMHSTAAWGDFDGDGDPDLALTGLDLRLGGVHSKIYRNDSGAFIDTGASLDGVYDSSIGWGDFDNDGDLDLAYTGYIGADPPVSLTRIYRNDDGSFVRTAFNVFDCSNASLAWGDADLDGDLDLLIAGTDHTGARHTILWGNNNDTAHHTPSAPVGLSYLVSGGDATFSWNPSTDVETQQPGLTYNLRVGTTPGGNEVVAAMADAETGFRHVPRFGNAGHNLSWTITLPELDTYYWSVQAIDASFAGGEFAVEQEFTVDKWVKISETPPVVVHQTRLLPASPNPFNPRTLVRFELEQPGPARLRIFDVAGRLVTTLVDAHHERGVHGYHWSGHDDAGRPVSAGVYYSRLETDTLFDTRSLTLVK